MATSRDIPGCCNCMHLVDGGQGSHQIPTYVLDTVARDCSAQKNNNPGVEKSCPTLTFFPGVWLQVKIPCVMFQAWPQATTKLYLASLMRVGSTFLALDLGLCQHAAIFWREFSPRLRSLPLHSPIPAMLWGTSPCPAQAPPVPGGGASPEASPRVSAKTTLSGGP